jgi:hypothetical protein
MPQPLPAQSYRFLPVLLGAGILAAVAGFRAVLTVIIALFTRDWARVGMAFVIVAVSAAGGATGGLVYVYLSGPLRKVPMVGPYIAGIATAGSCLGIMFLLLERVDRAIRLPFSETANLTALMLGTLLMGLVLGHTLLRDV